MNKLHRLILTLPLSLLSLSNFVQGCGWFTDERTADRVFYDAVDRIEFVEDNSLNMTRYPAQIERQYNSVLGGEGWVQYEDNPSRLHYNNYGRIDLIVDDVLNVTRKPTTKESRLNIYVLQSGGNLNGFNTN